MRNYNVRLRPQGGSKLGNRKYKMQHGNFDWQPNKSFNRFPGRKRPPLNEWFMGSVIFARIHYLTSHAPDAVRKRWKQAKARWMQKECRHRYRRGQSSRFLSKYTINRWL